MKIKSKYHGEMEVNTESVIHFQKGIPSFEDEKQFAIYPFSDESPFFIMQSIKSSMLAFILANPFDFFHDYEVKIPDQAIETLKIKEKDDVAIFVMLTVQDPFVNTTANLQGPLIINNNEKIGRQIILSDTDYQTKHFIMKTESPVGQED